MNKSNINTITPTGTHPASVGQHILDQSIQSISDEQSGDSINTITYTHYSSSLNEEQRQLRLARCYLLLSAVAKRKQYESLLEHDTPEHTEFENDSANLDNATQE